MVFSVFIQYFNQTSGDSDQTPDSTASDLALPCLPMSHKKGHKSYMG